MGCCSSLLLRSRLGHRKQHRRRCRCRPLVLVWPLQGCAAALALVPGPAAAAHVLLVACPQVLHPLLAAPAAASPQGLLGAPLAVVRCQVAVVVAHMLALGAAVGAPHGAWLARGAVLGAGPEAELALVVQQACCCAARAGLLCVEGRVVLLCWGRVQLLGWQVLLGAGGEGTAAECTALGHTAGYTAAAHTAAAVAAAACTELAAAAEQLQPVVPAAAARTAVAACTAAVAASVVVGNAAAAELLRLAVGPPSAAGTSAAAAEPACPEQRSQAADPACPGTYSAASDLYTGHLGHTVVGLDFLRSCDPSSRRLVADSSCWHSRKLTRT